MPQLNETRSLITGQNVLVESPVEGEKQMELGRAGFADMLHDTERNTKYFAALKMAISKNHSNGKPAYVLDIGTGTGILSMMAANYGADSVVACEAIPAMAECAKEIIKKNGLSEKIKVVSKLSMEMKVGPGLDMPHRANILVAEVFDTELIGEGAIPTFRHAVEHLLEEDSYVIPHSATIYAQVIESPIALSWNKAMDLTDSRGRILLRAPNSCSVCPGMNNVHDIQLSSLELDKFVELTKPMEIFYFNFSDLTEIRKSQVTCNVFQVEHRGKAQVIFMWWSLEMFKNGDITLSCAPVWAHPSYRNKPDLIPWRDHWMQAVYFLPNTVRIDAESNMLLRSEHDGFNFWFGIQDLEGFQKISSPSCKCGFHCVNSRTRIGQINQRYRNQAHSVILETALDKETSVVLVISDCSILGLYAGKLSKKAYILDPNPRSREVLGSYMRRNELINNIILLDSFDQAKKIVPELTHVYGEPHFRESILPWHNLKFGYLVDQLRQSNPGHMENVKIIPEEATLHYVLVEFKDFYKTRAPLNKIDRFDMSHFDQLIERACKKADYSFDAQPCWEYQSWAVSKVFEISPFYKFNQSFNEFYYKSTETISDLDGCHGTCNGIVMWVNWRLNKHTVITTGPRNIVTPGDEIKWDPQTRQAVYLLPEPKKVKDGDKFTLEWKLNPKVDQDANFSFSFL